MLKKKNGYYILPSFEKYSQIVHGFSTIQYGDMWPRNDKNGKNVNKFINKISNKSVLYFKTDQIHGSYIEKIHKNSLNVINDSDGLWSETKDIALCTVEADCMPILFFDPKHIIIGNIHVGWKGLSKGIIEEMITIFNSKKSDIDNIIVGIGPSIRDCCYDVGEELVHYFDLNSFTKRNGKLFLSLQKEAIKRLTEVGVKEVNIEDANMCTKDSEEFYSYRRDGNTDKFGEFVSIIGIV